MRERIELTREELYSSAVDAEIETRRKLIASAPLPPPDPAGARAWLHNSMFYLPVAGLLGALLAWLVMEPMFEDVPVIGGEVVLVQTDPMEISREFETGGAGDDVIKLTVERLEVYVHTEFTRLEPGADGQEPFRDWKEIRPGTCIEVAGEALDDSRTLAAFAVRPATPERAAAAGHEMPPDISLAQVFFFPVTALAIAVLLLFAEALSSRNWARGAERILLGGLFTVILVFLAYIPAGIVSSIGENLASDIDGIAAAKEFPPRVFFGFTVCRSVAWVFVSLGLGLGMHLIRSTKAERRNSAVGGMLGGALGGLVFGILERIMGSASFFDQVPLSRLFGMLAVGGCVGLFVALVDQLAREAWLRVCTGPLAGKAFVLYKSPTRIGSTPQADIYLFKDAGIEPEHAVIHRVGNKYEIESVQSRSDTVVGSDAVRRRRLRTGDRIRLGSTVLEFAERTTSET